MTLVLIDADSIVYIVGYNHREFKRDDLGTTEAVIASVDSVLEALFENIGATHYIGALSDSKSFRNQIYKYAPYKGTRGSKPDFIIEWENVIKEYMIEKGFIMVPNFEADDIVSVLKENYPDAIIASPDKDLRQSPGFFFDYSKNTPLENLTEFQANYNFYYSMLVGDSADNVKGVTGLGEVKAKKLLENCTNDIEMDAVVWEAYEKAYGHYYGSIIRTETKITLSLVTSDHPWYSVFETTVNMGESYDNWIQPVKYKIDPFSAALVE